MADTKVKNEGGAGAASKDKDSKDTVDKKGKAYNFSKGSTRVPNPTIKFEGKVDALKGFYYDCSDAKQAVMYAKTTKEIAE